VRGRAVASANLAQEPTTISRNISSARRRHWDLARARAKSPWTRLADNRKTTDGVFLSVSTGREGEFLGDISKSETKSHVLEQTQTHTQRERERDDDARTHAHHLHFLATANVFVSQPVSLED
jgi:hypothetical protein